MNFIIFMKLNLNSAIASLHKVVGYNLSLPIWLVNGRCSPQEQLQQWDSFAKYFMHFVSNMTNIIHY